jgi:hypothetical protein
MWMVAVVASACGDGGDANSDGAESASIGAGSGSSEGSSGAGSGSSSGADDGASLSTSVSASTSFTTSSATADDDAGSDGSSTESTADDSTDSGTEASTGGAAGCEGLGPAGLLLWTTLDDAGSVTAPAVGAGSGTSTTAPIDDFVTALDDDGIRLDALAESVTYPQQVGGVANIDFQRGTIDFCYQPNFDSFDSLDHEIFGANGPNGSFLRLRKAGGNNANALNMIVRDPTMTLAEFQAPTTNYTMSTGQWYRVTLSWDFTVGNAEQNIRMYLDGVELVPSNVPTGPLQMPPPDGDATMSIGAFGSGSADAVFDDFKLYGSALSP